MAFKPKQLKTVLPNNPKTEVATDSKLLVIFANAPMASIMPPKTMAQIINRMVHNIPKMPPELNNSVNFSLSVLTSTSVQTAVIIDLKFEPDKLLSTSP